MTFFFEPWKRKNDIPSCHLLAQFFDGFKNHRCKLVAGPGLDWSQQWAPKKQLFSPHIRGMAPKRLGFWVGPFEFSSDKNELVTDPGLDQSQRRGAQKTCVLTLNSIAAT